MREKSPFLSQGKRGILRFFARFQSVHELITLSTASLPRFPHPFLMPCIVTDLFIAERAKLERFS